MPEFRKDSLSEQWVIFAEGREKRPNEFRRISRQLCKIRCPFCAGHEADTPSAIAMYGPDGVTTDQREWLVRVVPNKYPALVGRASVPESLDPENGPGFCLNAESDSPPNFQPGFGSHEVVIESRRHVAGVSQLTEEEVRLTLLAFRDRLTTLGRDDRLQYAQIFKNVGPEAGASLEHAHSQIVATPMVPTVIQNELSASQRWFSNHGDCVFCHTVVKEKQRAERTVGESQNFIAICPYASRTPYETWVLPRQHVSHFECQARGDLSELAIFLRGILKKLESIHANLAYNFFIHTAPFDTLGLCHYHWHIEIIPRLTTAAGFEWGTGFFINPVLPEKAAKALRD